MINQLIERANYHWRDILRINGIPGRHLTGKHGPCPWCGGKDRFRFSDKNGTGSFICGQCGSGYGPHFLMRFHGVSFEDALKMVANTIGQARRRPHRPPPNGDDARAKVQRAWNTGIVPDAAILTEAADDSVMRYLAGRGIPWSGFHDIRQSSRGNMLVLVRDPAGHPCQLQVTMLTRDGARRTDTRYQRLYMEMPFPDGAAVRLMPYQKTLGIAEGVETALSAALLFGVPVWAALDAGLLRKWQPPSDLDRIVIFGDNDENFTGQAAAFYLANRIRHEQAKCQRHPMINVVIPENEGEDWNDELLVRFNTKRNIFAENSPMVLEKTSA